eukprot:759274-Hanusia_phi.AAC.1
MSSARQSRPGKGQVGLVLGSKEERRGEGRGGEGKRGRGEGTGGDSREQDKTGVGYEESGHLLESREDGWGLCVHGSK